MTKFFKKIYAYYIFLTTDDWRIIWSESGQWVNNKNQVTNRCQYMIEYSLKRNMFRLKTSGYLPDQHTQYNIALRKISEYNQNILSKEFKKNESK